MRIHRQRQGGGAGGGAGATGVGAGGGAWCDHGALSSEQPVRLSAVVTSATVTTAAREHLARDIIRPILEKYGLIGQFIAVAAGRREEPGHALGDAPDGHAAARGEFTLPEALADLRAQGFPFGGGNALGDAAVSHDLDGAIGQQHVDQHAVVARRVPDAQGRKDFQGARTRTQGPPQLRQ